MMDLIGYRNTCLRAIDKHWLQKITLTFVHKLKKTFQLGCLWSSQIFDG